MISVSVFLLVFTFLVPTCSHSDPKDQLVWVSSSGSKYHRKDCPTLPGASNPITLEEALRRGLESCKVCNPPQLPGPEAYRLDIEGVLRAEKVVLERLIPAKVHTVVDGDTVKVTIPEPRPPFLREQETLRLLGIDAPESSVSPRPEGFFGAEAAAYVQKRLEGQSLLLAFDRELRDRYGRVLAYLFFPDGNCFNLHLVESGYAAAYLDYPFALQKEFDRAGVRAAAEKRGMWK